MRIRECDQSAIIKIDSEMVGISRCYISWRTERPVKIEARRTLPRRLGSQCVNWLSRGSSSLGWPQIKCEMAASPATTAAESPDARLRRTKIPTIAVAAIVETILQGM
ncbi:hypothetical protein EV128_13154 [Rhizobium azibense]|nr:hypothetical protein EV128_13154 [Rhizobium azibense]